MKFYILRVKKVLHAERLIYLQTFIKQEKNKVLSKYKNYDNKFVSENMMGPNVIKIAEELTSRLNLKDDMKILDLGCGRALSSIFIAKEYGATVYAVDLWTSAKENLERAKSFGVENKVIPICADAHSLPYEEGFFDAVVSIDAYHYFGTNERYLLDYLAKFIKPNGIIAFASPGFTRELGNEEVEELKPYWICGKFLTFHSNKWWRDLWESSLVVDIIDNFDLSCHNEAWKDWLNSSNPYAQEDRPFFEQVKQLATIAVIAKRNDVDYRTL